MNATATPKSCRMRLSAATAADLMTLNPISIRHDAPVYDAIALMTERRINVAPVINDAGRPVGVVSVSDLLVHDREFADYCAARDQDRLCGRLASNARDAGPVADATTVAEIMTPAVIAVDLNTPVARVVERMLGMGVHHVFVADRMGTLAGVISALDVLRRMNEES